MHLAHGRELNRCRQSLRAIHKNLDLVVAERSPYNRNRKRVKTNVIYRNMRSPFKQLPTAHLAIVIHTPMQCHRLSVRGISGTVAVRNSFLVLIATMSTPSDRKKISTPVLLLVSKLKGKIHMTISPGKNNATIV